MGFVPIDPGNEAERVEVVQAFPERFHGGLYLFHQIFLAPVDDAVGGVECRAVHGDVGRFPLAARDEQRQERHGKEPKKKQGASHESVGWLEGFSYVVMVASGGGAAQKFAQKSGEEELNAKDNPRKRKVKVGTGGNQGRRGVVQNGNELVRPHHAERNEADEEHQAAKQPEEVHGLLAETADEPKNHQIQVAVDEAIEPELRTAILPGPMHDNLFSYLAEPRLLCHVGEETVHVVVDFKALYHFVFVCLEAAVEVVQLYPRYRSHRGVEELGRHRLGERIVAFLLPARNEIVALLGDHPVKLRNLIGRVLKIGVHRDDNPALRKLEAMVKSRGLAVVRGEPDAPDTVRLPVQVLDALPRSVLAAIVYENDFVGEPFPLHHLYDPGVKLRQRLLLVVKRNDNGDVYVLLHDHIICSSWQASLPRH